MTSLEKRLALLSGRMSHDAWYRLREALDHPRFPEILTDLEEVPGTLNVTHIQRSLARFLERRRNKR